LGHASRASATSSVALGDAAAVEATGTNSVALGAGSVAAQPNTVSVGTAGAERRITNIAAGTSPTDAVNVSQLSDFATSTLDLRRADQQDMRRGIAAAVAMGSASMPSAPGRTSYTMNVATFRGEQAVGGSLMYRLNAADPMAVTAGISFGGKKNNAAKVGIAGEF
jgi:autotransporter adhesin